MNKETKELLQNITMTAEFRAHEKYFEDDKENRDVYVISLEKGGRKFSFTFGQSITASGKFTVFLPSGAQKFNDLALTRKAYRKEAGGQLDRGHFKENPDFAVPTKETVLSCLTKSDPGLFEDFCNEYGYDTDSTRAEKTYTAVKNEWESMQKLFSDTELDLLDRNL
jgi:hypothetical protein